MGIHEAEMRELLAKGIVPIEQCFQKREWAPGKRFPKGFFMGPGAKDGLWNDARGVQGWAEVNHNIAGQCIGGINDIKPAAQIVNDMIATLITSLQQMGKLGSQVPSRL